MVVIISFIIKGLKSHIWAVMDTYPVLQKVQEADRHDMLGAPEDSPQSLSALMAALQSSPQSEEGKVQDVGEEVTLPADTAAAAGQHSSTSLPNITQELQTPGTSIYVTSL